MSDERDDDRTLDLPFEKETPVLPSTDPEHLVRPVDPSTSELAARHASFRSGSQKARLLVVHPDPPRGITSEEAAILAGLDVGRCCFWHRCGDLEAEGFLEKVPNEVRSDSQSGEKRMVRRLTERGVVKRQELLEKMNK